MNIGDFGNILPISSNYLSTGIDTPWVNIGDFGDFGKIGNFGDLLPISSN